MYNTKSKIISELRFVLQLQIDVPPFACRFSRGKFSPAKDCPFLSFLAGNLVTQTAYHVDIFKMYFIIASWSRWTYVGDCWWRRLGSNTGFKENISKITHKRYEHKIIHCRFYMFIHFPWGPKTGNNIQLNFLKISEWNAHENAVFDIAWMHWEQYMVRCKLEKNYFKSHKETSEDWTSLFMGVSKN